MASAPIVTIDDKVREAQRLKDEGNEFVKVGDFRKALNRYAKVYVIIGQWCLSAVWLSLRVTGSQLHPLFADHSRSAGFCM